MARKRQTLKRSLPSSSARHPCTKKAQAHLVVTLAQATAPLRVAGSTCVTPIRTDLAKRRSITSNNMYPPWKYLQCCSSWVWSQRTKASTFRLATALCALNRTMKSEPTCTLLAFKKKTRSSIASDAVKVEIGIS